MDQVKQRLDALSLSPMPMTQKQFADYFRKDIEDTASVIEKAKIQLQ